MKVLHYEPPFNSSTANAEKKIQPEALRAGHKKAEPGLDSEALTKLHRRYAHAKGHRLYATLHKYGLGGGVTLQQCHKVECPVCDLLNMKKRKVPRTADPSKTNLKVGEVTVQDLITFPVAGFEGSKYASVIIDAKSRFMSMRALRHKHQAALHSQDYIEKMRTLGHPLRRWRTDNGGEFLGDDFEATILRSGASHSFGAPHTPESQGVVERANGTIKRLIGKLMRDMHLPLSLWPALL